MKKIFIMIFVLGAIFVSSCGEGIKQRPLKNQSSDVLSRGASIEGNHNFLQDNDIKFWGNLNFGLYPTPSKAGKRPMSMGVAHHSSPRNRMHASYRLGASFATDDEARIAQRITLAKMAVPELVSSDSASIHKGSERMFLRCVETAESNRNFGPAAAMIGGYYYGWLATVLESVNPDTQLPDEDAVELAVRNIDNLNNYLNTELNSETDFRTSALIQKLQSSASEVKSIYHSVTISDEEKYSRLLGHVRDMDAIFE